MGPIIIFDKSTLESLNPDEAVWLDTFYLSNITPLFFVETLADLEKKVRGGRTPEAVVGSLAYKTPDFSSKPNVHHFSLLQGELLAGGKLDLEYGRPHIGGGKMVALEGQTGVFFDPSPEEEALSRWQDNEFMEIERQRAKKWRQALSNIDLEESYKFFQRFFPLSKSRDLAGVKRFVDFYMDEAAPEELLAFGLSLLGISEEGGARVQERWRKEGKPPIKEFAPYFWYLLSVDLFFYLAIAADLIGRGRATHKIDLAYLYYLPFCMVFTSNDKLHADIVPFFLRDNQSFVRGSEMKEDLAKLDAHYEALPEEVKRQGTVRFASYPPPDDSFLTARLWDKHMSSTWRENATKAKAPGPPEKVNERLMEHMRRMENAPAAFKGAPVSIDEADQLVIRRRVRGRKGKWNRFPPEVLEQSEKKENS